MNEGMSYVEYCERIREVIGGEDEIRGAVASAFFSRNNGYSKPIVPYGYESSEDFPKDVKLLKEYLNKDTIFKMDFTVRSESRNLVYSHAFTLLGTVSTICIEDKEGKVGEEDFYFIMVVSKNGLSTPFTAVKNVGCDEISFVDLPISFLEFNYYSKFNIKNNFLIEYLTKDPKCGDEEFIRILDVNKGEEVVDSYYCIRGEEDKLVKYLEHIANDVYTSREKVMRKYPNVFKTNSKERIYNSLVSRSTKMYFEQMDRFLGKYFIEYNYLMELGKVKGLLRDDKVHSIKDSNLINFNMEFLDKILGISSPSNEYVNGTNSDVTIFPYLYESAIEIKTLKDLRSKHGDNASVAISSSNNIKGARGIREEYKNKKLVNIVRYTSNISMFKRFVTGNDSPLTENITLRFNGHADVYKVLKGGNYYTALMKMTCITSNDKIKIESLIRSYYYLILQSEKVRYKFGTRSSYKALGSLIKATFNLYSCIRIIELTSAFLTSSNGKRDINPWEFKYLVKENLLYNAFVRYENAKKSFNNALISILRFKCFDLVDSIRKQNETGFITCRVINEGLSYEVLDNSDGEKFDITLLNYFKPSHFKITGKSKTSVGRGFKKSDVSADVLDLLPETNTTILPKFLTETIIYWNKRK